MPKSTGSYKLGCLLENKYFFSGLVMRQLYTELSRNPAPRCEQGGHQVTEEVIKKPQQHFASDCDQEEHGGSTKSLDSLFQFMLPFGFNLNWDPDS